MRVVELLCTEENDYLQLAIKIDITVVVYASGVMAAELRREDRLVILPAFEYLSA